MSNYQVSRACVICDTKNNSHHYCTDSGLVYVQCDTCKLIYVDNFANNEQMMRAYTGGGFKSFRRKLFAPIRKMRNIKGYAHFLERARGNFAVTRMYSKGENRKTYLDIGCNKGFLMAAAAEQGCDVHGVELVTELIRPFCNTYPQFRNHWRLNHDNTKGIFEALFRKDQLTIQWPAGSDQTFFNLEVDRELVAPLVAGEADCAGSRLLSWDGRDSNGRALAAGCYFLRLQVDGRVQSRKLLIVR